MAKSKPKTPALAQRVAALEEANKGLLGDVDHLLSWVARLQCAADGGHKFSMKEFDVVATNDNRFTPAHTYFIMDVCGCGASRRRRATRRERRAIKALDKGASSA